MHTIALLTDFGYKDGFVGAMKGVIKSINPSVDIIDISHEITPFNILEASLVLYSVYRYFPGYTIFVVVVDPGVGTSRNPVVIKTENYFFVLPDNGLITPILKEEQIKQVIKITNQNLMLKRVSETFHGRDIFAPVSAYISRGVPLDFIGENIEPESLKKFYFPEPVKKGKQIIGEIISFDRFGNAITNIRYENLPEKFKIYFRNFAISNLSKNFQEGNKEKPNIIIGSTGFLELFLPEDSFREKYSVKTGEQIIVTEEK